MRKGVYISALVLIIVLAANWDAEAQCSMCRAVVGSNVEGGETVRGLGLNNAILYIMGIPYLCLAVLGWVFWGDKLAGKKSNK